MRILAGRLLPELRTAIRLAVEDWPTSIHAQERSVEKGVPPIRNDWRLVELHNDAGTFRALIRDSVGTCQVLDFHEEVIVTTYRNDVNDRHDTLNRDAYYWGPISRKVLTNLTQGYIIP